jgi:hypothetical protein
MKLWKASSGQGGPADLELAKKLQGLASLGEAAIIKKGVRIALSALVMPLLIHRLTQK